MSGYMSQYWLITAPRKGHCLAGESNALSEWLFSGESSSITALLIRPVIHLAWKDGENSDYEMSPKVDSRVPIELAVSQNKAPIQFMDLPTEMHDKLFSHVAFYDILSLCLTNRYLYRLGIRHAKAAVARSIGPWAGEPLVCIGDLSMDSFEAIVNSDNSSSLSLYDVASKCYGKVPADWMLPKFHWQGHGNYSKIQREVSGNTIMSRYFNELSSIHNLLPDFYPKHPWVLRNLTTKEFVREELIRPLGIGDAVCSRICWSSDPPMSLNYKGDIHHGVWAGHCFDIIGSDVIGAEMRTDWKDVSEDIMQELDAIWAGQFGPNWRDGYQFC